MNCVLVPFIFSANIYYVGLQVHLVAFTYLIESNKDM